MILFLLVILLIAVFVTMVTKKKNTFLLKNVSGDQLCLNSDTSLSSCDDNNPMQQWSTIPIISNTEGIIRYALRSNDDKKCMSRGNDGKDPQIIMSDNCRDIASLWQWNATSGDKASKLEIKDPKFSRCMGCVDSNCQEIHLDGDCGSDETNWYPIISLS